MDAAVERFWTPPATAGVNLGADLVDGLDRLLEDVARRFSRVAIACSLQAEDLVVLDAAARLRLPFRPFVLDTLRLHDETLAYLDDVTRRFGIEIERVKPDPEAVATFEATHGRFAFYDGEDERKACCNLRKVRPLAAVLAGADAWITGQRRGQSETRSELAEEEHDATFGIAKFNPLAGWSEAAVWQYGRVHDLPPHPLYARGFASIGCEPCTRAIRAGEPIRAGRWWWEGAASKECGLHIGHAADAPA